MAIGALTEEVAANLEEAAEVTRQINTEVVGSFFIGAGIGMAIGFFFGYRYNKEKIKAEAFKETEEEIAKIREFYRRTALVDERVMADTTKPPLDEVIEEKGYSVVEPEERPLKPPVPLVQEPSTRSREPFIKRTAAGEKDKNTGWVYVHELSNRSPLEPYIIHQDEFSLNESEYQQVQYTYYAGDDVLTDEDETVINNRNNLIGEANLARFGHGSDDFNIVYIRNSELELEFEVVRTPNSYEVEIQGLEPDDSPN